MLISRDHSFARTCRIAILSILALSLLLTWPFLLKNHHHADFEETTHCAVCLFASAHFVASPEPIDASLRPTLLGHFQTAAEPLVASVPVRTPCGRAPPTA